MAQKVRIVLEDDLDGSDATQTIKFSLGNAAYEIDLSDENSDKLRVALAPFLDAARRVGRPAPSTRAKQRCGTSPAEIRAWAISNGLAVPARGRIPADARAAYDAAH